MNMFMNDKNPSRQHNKRLRKRKEMDRSTSRSSSASHYQSESEENDEEQEAESSDALHSEELPSDFAQMINAEGSSESFDGNESDYKPGSAIEVNKRIRYSRKAKQNAITRQKNSDLRERESQEVAHHVVTFSMRSKRGKRNSKESEPHTPPRIHGRAKHKKYTSTEPPKKKQKRGRPPKSTAVNKRKFARPAQGQNTEENRNTNNKNVMINAADQQETNTKQPLKIARQLWTKTKRKERKIVKNTGNNRHSDEDKETYLQKQIPPDPNHHQQAYTAHSTVSSSSSSLRRGQRYPTQSQAQVTNSQESYAHLDPKLFHSTMTQQQVAKIMGLATLPMYRTDEKGYIGYNPGLIIGQNFVLVDTLGRGTFSKVFEVHNMVDQTKCAIKVVRNTPQYIEAAKTELRVLQHVTNADDGNSACIHLKDYFSWNNHPCFVFKLYGPSIYTVMLRNRFRPFPDSIVRSLTYQICNAIQFIHHLGIIFTDLKPENMLFVDGRTHHVEFHGKTYAVPLSTRIKIVDFGSAVYEPRYDPNSPKTWKLKDGYNYLIQTRHYRAPEVVLEIPWKQPVDVWSVGCVILEFLSGLMVFYPHCPIDHLNQMQKMIGTIPRDLIRCASDGKYKQLFHHPDGTLRLERVRASRQQAKRLDAYFNHHKLEHRHLYDLVSRCLKWRANERIYGHNLLKHEYFHFLQNMSTNREKFPLHPFSASGSTPSSYHHHQ